VSCQATRGGKRKGREGFILQSRIWPFLQNLFDRLSNALPGYCEICKVSALGLEGRGQEREVEDGDAASCWTKTTRGKRERKRDRDVLTTCASCGSFGSGVLNRLCLYDDLRSPQPCTSDQGLRKSVDVQ